ncbi:MULTISPECIES: hypothetical protein [unclassified Sphingopyxis]|uniref:hypothetical protein n=1 Tax=Sphingopyxis sp. DBS4 TaxID=2968500 RepID=UPI00214B99C9|nr:hypothetical protein [Sphingopyxis sp. DBS4]
MPENRPAARRQIATALCIAAGALLCHAAPALANDVIIDAAMGDIDGDGSKDLVTLTLPEGREGSDVGIVVYLRNAGVPALNKTIELPARFWGTSSAGQQPEVAILQKRSITVHTQNTGFGRSHWERTYTLAWRKGELIVAGFTYAFYDTIDHGQSGRCDVNLLTGRGVRDDKAIAAAGQRVLLVDWEDSIGLAACGMEEG